jgi:hypothetical protein
LVNTTNAYEVTACVCSCAARNRKCNLRSSSHAEVEIRPSRQGNADLHHAWVCAKKYVTSRRVDG